MIIITIMMIDNITSTLAIIGAPAGAARAPRRGGQRGGLNMYISLYIYIMYVYIYIYRERERDMCV